MGIQVTLITELVTTKTMIHMRSDPGPSGMREAIKSARPKGKWGVLDIDAEIGRYLAIARETSALFVGLCHPKPSQTMLSQP